MPWWPRTCGLSTLESEVQARLHPCGAEPGSPPLDGLGKSTNPEWWGSPKEVGYYEKESCNPTSGPPPPMDPHPCPSKLTNRGTGRRQQLLARDIAPTCENPALRTKARFCDEEFKGNDRAYWDSRKPYASLPCVWVTPSLASGNRDRRRSSPRILTGGGLPIWITGTSKHRKSKHFSNG